MVHAHSAFYKWYFLVIYLFSYFLIWLGGRITSPRVWLGAGGQGVTLKLAWGPSNSSPWICILFLISFRFFLFLSSFYALFFSSFFLSSCIFEERFWYVSVAFFRFFFFEIRCNIFLSVYVIIIIITTFSFFFNYLISAFWSGSVANQCILRYL